jgi:hypothetical protein
MQTYDLMFLHNLWNAPKPLDIARDKGYKADNYIVEGRIYIDDGSGKYNGGN